MMVLGFILGSLFAWVYLHAGLLYELRMERNNQTFHLPMTEILVRIAEYAGMKFYSCF